MVGTIVNFRGSHRRKKFNQMIIQLDGVNTRDKAKALLGKTAVWSSPGKEPKKINGKVSRAHGNKGAVSVVFERGMPGQSLGTEVEVK